MKILVKKGKTSKRVFVFVQDSSKTDGSGLASLTSATSGLICSRSRDDDGNAGATSLSLAAGTRGTWSSGGFVEKDSANQPGVYELGLDNAGLVTGSDGVVYYLKGAANMAPCVLEVQLTDFDPQDGVRLGLTALPNAAANAAGGLPVSSAGGLDLDEMNVDIEAIQTGVAAIPTTPLLAANVPANFAALGITGGGAISEVVLCDTVTSYTGASVKKNTALNAFEFLMTDSTLHAPATGLTVTATRSIDGGAFGACANAVVEVAAGIYKINLATTDLNGNVITLQFTAAGADTTFITIPTQS